MEEFPTRDESKLGSPTHLTIRNPDQFATHQLVADGCGCSYDRGCNWQVLATAWFNTCGSTNLHLRSPEARLPNHISKTVRALWAAVALWRSHSTCRPQPYPPCSQHVHSTTAARLRRSADLLCCCRAVVLVYCAAVESSRLSAEYFTRFAHLCTYQALLTVQPRFNNPGQ